MEGYAVLSGKFVHSHLAKLCVMIPEDCSGKQEQAMQLDSQGLIYRSACIF